MAKFLIVYGTKQGQAGRIAEFIANELRRKGHIVDIGNADSINRSLQLNEYDFFIIGGGVHVSGYPRALVQWVRERCATLKQKPAAFYSVCLGILQNDPKVRADEERIMLNFFKKTGWTPTRTTIFAGALAYSKYNWFLKRIMRAIARHAGVDTDMNRDYEYTDWNQVKQFAQQLMPNA